MNRMVRKPPIALGAAALALVLSLAGCHEANAPGAEASASAEADMAGPDAKPGMALSGARLTLPAVSGRPGAVYFTLANTGRSPVKLVAAYLEGAGKAEMHETVGGAMKPLPEVEVPAGGSVRFAPGGKHVMAFDLATSLKPGGSTELTLSFADGDKISAPVAVEAAGEAAGAAAGAGADAMPGMDMSGH